MRAPEGLSVRLFLLRVRVRAPFGCVNFHPSGGTFGCTLRVHDLCALSGTLRVSAPSVHEFFFSHRTLRFAPRLVNTTLRVGCTLRVHVRTPAVCYHHLRWVRFAPKNNVIASLRFARLGNVACRAHVVPKMSYFFEIFNFIKNIYT